VSYESYRELLRHYRVERFREFCKLVKGQVLETLVETKCIIPEKVSIQVERGEVTINGVKLSAREVEVMYPRRATYITDKRLYTATVDPPVEVVLLNGKAKIYVSMR